MLLRRYSNRYNQPKVEEVAEVVEPQTEEPVEEVAEVKDVKVEEPVEVAKPKKSRK